MAILHGNDTTGQNASSSTSYTLAHNLSASSGNNRLLVVGVGLDLTGTPTLTCKYNDVDITALTSAYLNGMQVRLFYLLDDDLPSSSGSYNIVASSSSAGYLKIHASDFTGVAQEAPGMEDINTASGNSLSTYPNPVVTNSVVWDMKANSSSAGTWNSRDADYISVGTNTGGSASTTCASYRISENIDEDTCTDGNTQTAQMAGACAVWAPYIDAIIYNRVLNIICSA